MNDPTGATIGIGIEVLDAGRTMSNGSTTRPPVIDVEAIDVAAEPAAQDRAPEAYIQITPQTALWLARGILCILVASPIVLLHKGASQNAASLSEPSVYSESAAPVLPPPTAVLAAAPAVAYASLSTPRGATARSINRAPEPAANAAIGNTIEPADETGNTNPEQTSHLAVAGHFQQLPRSLSSHTEILQPRGRPTASERGHHGHSSRSQRRHYAPVRVVHRAVRGARHVARSTRRAISRIF